MFFHFWRIKRLLSRELRWDGIVSTVMLPATIEAEDNANVFESALVIQS